MDRGQGGLLTLATAQPLVIRLSSEEYTTRLACSCLGTAQGHASPAPAGGLHLGNTYRTKLKAITSHGDAANDDDDDN